MPKFTARVSWVSYADVEVEAESVNAAESIVMETADVEQLKNHVNTDTDQFDLMYLMDENGKEV